MPVEKFYNADSLEPDLEVRWGKDSGEVQVGDLIHLHPASLDRLIQTLRRARYGAFPDERSEDQVTWSKYLLSNGVDPNVVAVEPWPLRVQSDGVWYIHYMSYVFDETGAKIFESSGEYGPVVIHRMVPETVPPESPLPVVFKKNR